MVNDLLLLSVATCCLHLAPKGLSVNNSYNLLVILAITRVSFQLK
ncbi:MAG: hypothetical protein ACI9UA_005537 [Pseudoalteromonas tetraodonis]|jgi:hypothetical protein